MHLLKTLKFEILLFVFIFEGCAPPVPLAKPRKNTPQVYASRGDGRIPSPDLSPTTPKNATVDPSLDSDEPFIPPPPPPTPLPAVETPKRKRRQVTGDTCKYEERNHECRRQCREMYLRKADRENCIDDLTARQIDNFSSVYTALKNARNLNRINIEDLQAYVDESITGIRHIIRTYSAGKAKNFLSWVIANEDVTEYFIDIEENFNILDPLLMALSPPFTNSELHIPFTRPIDRRAGSLFETAFEYTNDTAVDWFMDYIASTDSNCDGNAFNNFHGCFRLFCKIGRAFDDSSVQDSLEDSFVFNEYIDKIIRNGVNYSTNSGSGSAVNGNWWPHECEDNIDRFRDVGDIQRKDLECEWDHDGHSNTKNKVEELEAGDWVTALCRGLE